jgi:RING finger protein 121
MVRLVVPVLLVGFCFALAENGFDAENSKKEIHVLSKHHEAILKHHQDIKARGVGNRTGHGKKASAGIFFLILVLLVVAQSAITYWKKKHNKSFMRVTLVGMWLIPISFSAYLHFWRYCFIWATFSIVTGYHFYLTIQQPMHKTTPRKV